MAKDTEPREAWEQRCLAALGYLGAGVEQWSAPDEGRPAFSTLLKLAWKNLTVALAGTPAGIIEVSASRGLLTVNGNPIEKLAILPPALEEVFNRFDDRCLRLQSGATLEELSALSAAFAGALEAPDGADPQALLLQRGVSSISFEKTARPEAGPPPKQAKDDESRSLEATLESLKRIITEAPAEAGSEARADPRPAEAAQAPDVVAGLVDLLQRDITRHVGEVAKALKEEPRERAEEKSSAQDPLSSMAEGLSALDDLAKILSANAPASATAGLDQLSLQRDFVSHVTHELRSPLTAIKAALEILQGKLSDKIRAEDNNMLTMALRNSDRLNGLITSILDFAKIDAGKMTVSTKATDPETIALEAVESMMPWAMRKRVALSLSAAPGLPKVMADSPRTVQVLVNLISNALKFTPAEGSVMVSVVLGEEDGFVVFSVQDSGRGIPKAEQSKLFQKFSQVPGTQEQVGGTGLGLVIAKALIELQKGRVWVESAEGQGATFFFTLPVCALPWKV